MTTRPGYLVTATFFLPADPQHAAQMALDRSASRPATVRA